MTISSLPCQANAKYTTMGINAKSAETKRMRVRNGRSDAMTHAPSSVMASQGMTARTQTERTNGTHDQNRYRIETRIGTAINAAMSSPMTKICIGTSCTLIGSTSRWASVMLRWPLKLNVSAISPPYPGIMGATATPLRIQ